VVHWDGKLLPDITGSVNCKVEWLPVLLFSIENGETKLLGILKLTSGTGQAAANAIHKQLQSWKCESIIIGMCFDTTAVNTGRLNGACMNVEKSLGRSLLWLACRHHMFEVLLSDIFNECNIIEPSTRPEILILKKLKDNWSKINHKLDTGDRQSKVVHF